MVIHAIHCNNRRSYWISTMIMSIPSCRRGKCHIAIVEGIIAPVALDIALGGNTLLWTEIVHEANLHGQRGDREDTASLNVINVTSKTMISISQLEHLFGALIDKLATTHQCGNATMKDHNSVVQQQCERLTAELQTRSLSFTAAYHWHVVVGSSSMVVTPPPSNLLLPYTSTTPLPLLVSDAIEDAFSSGLTSVAGTDWRVIIRSPCGDNVADGNEPVVTMHVGCVGQLQDKRPPRALVRYCTLEAQRSSREVLDIGECEGNDKSIHDVSTVNNLRFRSNMQSVQWMIVPWIRTSSRDDASCHVKDASTSSDYQAIALSPQMECLLEGVLDTWRLRSEGGSTGGQHLIALPYGPDGDVSSISVLPSHVDYWQLLIKASPPSLTTRGSVTEVSATRADAVLMSRCQVQRCLIETHLDSSAIKLETDQQQQREFPGCTVHRTDALTCDAAALLCSMMNLELHSPPVQPHENKFCATTRTASTRTTAPLYDSLLLTSTHVQSIVNAMLFTPPNKLVPLLDEYSVTDVREALRLPFVEPDRFVCADDAPSSIPSSSRPCHEMLWEGLWMPLSPLNEWLLSKGSPSLYLRAMWCPVAHNVAQLPISGINNNGGSHVQQIRNYGEERDTIVWLRQVDEAASTLLMICRGIPMSLGCGSLFHHASIQDRSPVAPLLQDHVAIDASNTLDPRGVLRTWKGSRDDINVLEYFALRGAGGGRGALGRFATGSNKRSSEEPNNINNSEGITPGVPTNSTNSTATSFTSNRRPLSPAPSSAIAARLAANNAASQYHYRFPVLPTPL